MYGKDKPFSWIRRLNIGKIAIFPKLTYRINTISIKIRAILFV